MQEMLDFVTFRQVSNIRAYGLGTYLYERKISFGREAIGHGGGNIGSSTYMIYLPESHVSVIVMVNAFPSGAINRITKQLIRTVLRHQGDMGPLPYIPLFPTGVIIISNLIIMMSAIRYIRRRRKRTSPAHT